MLKRTLLGAIAICCGGLPATAQDAYVVGLTGALTGPPSSTYAPAVDALAHLYRPRQRRRRRQRQKDPAHSRRRRCAAFKGGRQYEKTDHAGQGRAGGQCEPVVHLRADDRGDQERRRASAVCERRLPAERLSAGRPAAVLHDRLRLHISTARRRSISSRRRRKGPVKIGFSAMAIPLSRGEMDYAQDLSKTMGMTPVDEQVIPPPTADYTPFATKLKDAGPNWVYSWAPWVTQVRTLEALRKLGWQDDYIAWGHLEAESELARLKDGKFFVINANALFQEGLPIQKEIETRRRRPARNIRRRP